ncbi:MAG TPA: response regulator [Sphingobacteriaceae bacterium]
MASLIMYVDDDSDDLIIFKELLQDINPAIKYLHAANGKEALEMLEELVILPDYIFLDINMPVMDGQTFLSKLRADRRFRSIPVIVYTTSTRPDDKKAFSNLGANDYIVKPSTYVDAKIGISRVVGNQLQ